MWVIVGGQGGRRLGGVTKWGTEIQGRYGSGACGVYG